MLATDTGCVANGMEERCRSIETEVQVVLDDAIVSLGADNDSRN